MILLPENIVQGLIQNPANGDTQIDCGVVISALDGADRLSGDADSIGQTLLGQIFCRPRGLEPQVFAQYITSSKDLTTGRLSGMSVSFI